MKVKCACKKPHNLSTAEMAKVISAYHDGRLQIVTREGIKPICITTAL